MPVYGARYEMKLLLEDYEYKKAQLDAVMEEIEKLCRKIPESEQMLAIKGIGVITVAGFLAEVGDVRRFESPRHHKSVFCVDNNVGDGIGNKV